MFISSNGRRARTKLAEILVRMDYSIPNCLRAVSYPAPRTVRLFTQAQDFAKGHIGGTISQGIDIGRTVSCYEQKENQHVFFRTGDTVVETAVINDGEGEWFIRASRLDVQYSDMTSRALGFGSYKSGDGETSSRVPMVHLSRLPAPSGWPVPEFVEDPNSSVELNDSFYSERGY